MLQWHNWTTFDMIGDLAFSESFDCLENARTDPWIQAVFGNVKSVPFIGSLCRYGLGRLIQWITPKRLLELRMQNYLRNVDKIERRIQKGTDRGDFWDNVLEKSDFEKGTGMTKQEMISYASILVLGGSETTATSLSETTHLPCTHPEVLKKLNAEVRSVFSDEDGIDLISVNKLDYMLAVLDESMRLYPPVPKQGCRKVPVKGAVICGRWVPGGVCSITTTMSFTANTSSDLRPSPTVRLESRRIQFPPSLRVPPAALARCCRIRK